MSADELGAQLAGWGKVALLDTRGRRSGRDVRVAVGYVRESDGGLLVAAGSVNAAWAANLDADPECLVTIGDVTATYLAEPLDDAGAARVVRELILRYGTPAETLGHGPAFRLRPVAAS